MKCYKCGAEMNKGALLTVGRVIRQVWKCPECTEVKIERISVKANVKRRKV